MATKKKSATELLPQEDPRAPLDGAVLLKAAKPVLADLEKDLLKRADESLGVTTALKERHTAEKKAQRTADGYTTWRRAFVEQVAVAWFLGVVFVRTLEDRGLIERNRIAGEGAIDSQKSFFALAPSLSERDYLLTVFKELSHLPAAADLFDEKHNPVWLLAPSAEAAQKLLALFRIGSDVNPAFRFGGDTRFLGDLYQDLSENVRKRYALLQTPRFVESYILDKTLDPAIEKFGLDHATLIDPTCGSGHFLLGAFERLLDRRLAAEPGVDVRQAAKKALDAVAGTDINPYAISIARFRLTLTFLERASYSKLKQAPKLPLHLAVADSLLHNPQKGLEQKAEGQKGKTSDLFAQVSLGEQAGVDRTEWEGEIFRLEDPEATADVLGTVEKPKRYAAVVGNPPYITVKDAVLRDRYRAMYSSAFRSYSLAVPFKERFFQLGRESACVGMITANSFMKREFGTKLIEEYLPTVNLTSIVNTSGAYIPGHGTPTVMLFGTSERPKASFVHTILASRGEPSTPSDAEQGLVWQSIAHHGDEVGFENDYISVTETERIHLAEHPWSLGGGGATELKALLEERAEKTLTDIVDVVGFGAVTREDDVFLLGDKATLDRWGIPAPFQRRLMAGESVRDWSAPNEADAIWPYSEETLEPVIDPDVCRALWPWKTQLANRVAYGKTQLERGLPWCAYSMFFQDRFRTPLTITFAFVATHNHFVLDRGGKVFKQSAPIIKLPESATEDDHYALLAYLNSSTACFWMKQAFFDKGGGGIGGGLASSEWEKFYEFDGTKLKLVPLPVLDARLSSLGKRLEQCAARAAEMVDEKNVRSRVSLAGDPEAEYKDLCAAREKQFDEMCSLQEELDWHVYELMGLAKLPKGHTWLTAARNQRPALVRYAASDAPKREVERLFEFCGMQIPKAIAPCWEKLLLAIEESTALRMIEQPQFKRLLRETWRPPKYSQMCQAQLLDGLEKDAIEHGMTWTMGSISSALVIEQNLAPLVVENAAAFLSAYRFTSEGLEKHAAWQHTWDFQRREDAGENVGEILVPPKYDQKDYRSATYWRLRGKLDVPKERFISYPGCESDEDGEAVYGWAGWDHRQRAQALGALYANRKDEEGWSKERLQPMLAGILELLPWLSQWHNEPDEAFDGAIPAVQFREFLDAECAEHGFTYDDLRAWRPPEKKRAAKKASKKKASKKSPLMPAEGPGTS